MSDGDASEQQPPTEGRGRGAPVGDVVVAIDIGGTKMAAGLVTLRGELIDRDRVDVDHDLNAERLFAGLKDLIDGQLARAREHHNMRPVAVGVGSAGPISPNCETVSPLNIHAWRQFPLR
ncbi:MAG TPA: ROK family protein, partial [Ilumatobacteraceae bacterium]|nr:ROK family protein [Ilumatobacteraceae bacterium]